MNALKRATPFTLAMLPVAALGGAFVTLYQLDLYGAEMRELLLAQFGNLQSLLIVCAVQAMFISGFCALTGHILAQKTGLARPFVLRRESLIRTLAAAAVAGILFSLDYWAFGQVLPQVRESIAPGLTMWGWLSAVLYGGVVEEILLRLFMMSLLSFLLWKLFWRKADACPQRAIVLANWIAALLFAAGHLPATAATFGQLSSLVLLRCFLLNGGFGLLFGRLYRKYGIPYAMLAHAGVHVVSKAIWTLLS